jgi:hypothetical protein
VKKTKHGDYQKIIYFSAWSEYEIHIIFTENIVKSRMGRYGNAGAAGDGRTAALHTTLLHGSCLFYPLEAGAGVLTHEAFHAIWSMFSWAGVKEWDNETTAYHLGWLVGNIANFQSKVLECVKSSTKEKVTP